VKSTVVFIAGAAVGVAAAVVADPAYGHRRRTVLRDRLASRCRRCARLLCRVERDAANVLRGTVAEVTARMCQQPVDTEILVERVRSQMGHAARHLGEVEVTAVNGCVTLKGRVPVEDHDALVRAVRETRGVCAVDDRLVIHQPTVA
jgi:osmotically-inducible protein OsmY